ncbi:MAG TPA: NADPH-dependent FMN reductase [Prolixibacteraceae bacterium]|jgi:NAD(P)H-dependent FMN reductase|nr:NADPH-dependent FMN reductase [Prolixibacteraceae bacterium]
MENNLQDYPNQQEPLRFLVFSASLRKDSFNTRLAQLAAQVIEKNGGKADFANMDEFDCPSFNQDLELSDFHPSGAIEFRKRLLGNDAFIIASPEYNASIPGFLKNAIDWVSRFRPQPLKDHNALLMSASPSMAGGNRALWSLRIPLEHLGARVYPNMFSLAMAHQAFNPEGSIADATLAQRFEENLVAFMSLVESSKHYPCIKKAWVEFLGEKPDPVIERVE